MKKGAFYICIVVLMLVGMGTVNAYAGEIPLSDDGYAVATGTDASYETDIQAGNVNDVYSREVSINDIQTMDMGRYDIVGVDAVADSSVRYRWLAYDFTKGTWNLVWDWTTNTNVFWVPSHAGDYYLYVEAMANGEIVGSHAKLVYFSGCVTSLGDISYTCGTRLCTYDISYTTNDSELMFRWQQYDVEKGTWNKLSDWSSESSGSWVPEHSGDYFLYVEAKGGDGSLSSKLIVCHVDDTTISSFGHIGTGYINEGVILEGKYNDPTQQVGSHRYLVFDGTFWSEIGNYGELGIWAPNQEGQYLFCYEIYDKNGDLIQQSFDGYVSVAPYATLGSMNITHPVGYDYKLTTDVQTNDSGILYRWVYCDVANGAWYDISGWSTNPSTEWTAPGVGYYWLYMEAMLRDGTVQYVIDDLITSYIEPEKDAMRNVANSYSSPTGYLLLVNKTTHKVGVFTGAQGSWSLQYYWDCGDGAAETPTPTGVFSVASRGYYFDSGAYRCYWYTQFYGGYLFHSVLYNKYNGALADGRVGMALSHGCVRLQIENAKWIYDNIPRNTTVVVYN